jgi:pimeloyl-ACP methyl ester carboxylesterase
VVHDEREFRVSTDGGELVGWLRDGNSEAPPMLLLHGGPGLSEYLKPLADELDGLSPIARYQQRGLAPSVASGARHVERHVADAVDVLDGLGWPKAIVIGHSWGGHLAMHFAVAHPERLTAFVALDPLGGVGDGGMASFVQNLNSSVPERDRPRQRELEALESPTDAERREGLGYVWPFYFADPAKAPPMPGFGFDPDAGQTWASINEHFAARTLEGGLQEVDVPFLLIHGEKSPIPIDEVVKTAEVVPNARVVRLTNCGHWPWLEQPGSVRAAIEMFANEQGRIAV